MLVTLALMMTSVVAAPLDVTPAEMDTMRQWVAAKFEGKVPEAPSGARITVSDNHGPVQSNARGGKPMKLAVALPGDARPAFKEFSRGLYCHANSKLTVHLPKGATHFEAMAGVDSNDQTSGGRGSVVFIVGTGKELWRSGVMREGMAAVPVSVDLQGADEFTLEVTDGGDGVSCDQADWVEARVTLEDKSELWLGDLAISGSNASAPDTDPPFSFVYGGEPSSKFLSSWKTERIDKEIEDARHGKRKQHTMTFADPATGLVVRCVGIEYREFPTVEWTLHFKNTGNTDTPVLSDIQPIDTGFQAVSEGDFTLHHIRGDDCTPNSYAVLTDVLAPKSDIQIANTGGRPTQISFPYFNIEWPGGGALYVLSWAGQWSTRFARDDKNGLRTTGGQELTHFTLHPGEEVRSPLIVLQFYRGDWMRAQNIWRRWMFAHNLPQPGGKPLKTMRSLCTGNFYPALMTEAKQEMVFLKRHVDERIVFDCWWQDAGWYPCDGPGWPKTGTWEVDPVRFPKGLRELSDYMHANGKVTMVWFEPERVHAGTWLTDNHPEWVHGGAKGGLLKLGVPECRDWLTNHIDRVMTEQGIDFYRQDFNMDPLAFWRENDALEDPAGNRQGMTEIQHVEGYFAYWDELLRRHPNMLIDSCASGGRRNDLETLRRAVPLLRSDWYGGPTGQQALTYGLSLWVPYHGTGVIYEKDVYWVRSSMVAEMSFGPDVQGVDKFDFARFRRLTQEHERISPYFLGDYYPLTPYSLGEDQWMAWQFNRPDLGEGVVQAFRREKSVFVMGCLPLQGLDPNARYSITDLDDPTPVEASGKELIEKGFMVTVSEKPAAKTFVYKRL